MSRPSCQNCLRPLKCCLCEAVSYQTTATPLFVFQHPDEASHPFTTARLSELGASSVKRQDALEIDRKIIEESLGLPENSKLALVYFNHQYAEHDSVMVDMQQESHQALEGYAGFIVLDGTWRNTRELLLRNTWLMQLTTFTFVNAPKTEYTLRKNQHGDGLSTIETVACLLSAAEPDFDRRAYLKPMHKLVADQKRYSK